ncbi:MAG: beta-phosphoglucomutase [Flavobacteriaceae bacterium]|jgi:beta-phosphoglucomutase|nr:beta-phosphoglucomutase [Flavobacteriaceae bacterium]MDG1213022.1 beta-phosphoglucomutase [Flavobacteriaceae bacterium]MDG1774936.1 beta-phosphoglucomutase [Flavobacteriaceae bacterium]MDG2415472.1 beta-phosphoglucomutase [Flavobacteriaceae bacterium]
MPTGFIFDLDGVIVDTAKYHFKAWQSLAKNLQYNFTEQDNEQFKGVSRVRSLELLLEMAQYKATEKEKEQWLIDKNTHYLALISHMNNSEILPGITEILKTLKAQQIPVALGSASKNAQPILEKVGLLSYFDVLVDGNEVTMAKPNPEVFLTAAKGLGVAPEDCVVFEDAQAGVAAAKAAKMTCVGIGDPAILFNADHCFTSTAEITPSFVQSLIA